MVEWAATSAPSGIPNPNWSDANNNPFRSRTAVLASFASRHRGGGGGGGRGGGGSYVQWDTHSHPFH